MADILRNKGDIKILSSMFGDGFGTHECPSWPHCSVKLGDLPAPCCPGVGHFFLYTESVFL